MKVLNQSLYSLPSRGYMTLQIPDLVIGEVKPEEFVELPDEWFQVVGSNGVRRPLNGSGILYWSEKGFQANRDQIKAAFDASASHRGSWVDFETKAIQFLQEVKTKTEKHVKFLRKKADKLEGLLLL